MGGHTGRTRVGQEAERARGNHVPEPLLWFPWVSIQQMDEAGPAGLGLASLNHFSGLWAQGLSLVVWSLPWGDEGRWTVAQSVKAPKRRWGSELWVGWFAFERRDHR